MQKNLPPAHKAEADKRIELKMQSRLLNSNSEFFPPAYLTCPNRSAQCRSRWFLPISALPLEAGRKNIYSFPHYNKLFIQVQDKAKTVFSIDNYDIIHEYTQNILGNSCVIS